MESAPLTQSKKAAPLSASKAGTLSQSKKDRKEKKQKTEDLLASLEAIHKIGVLSDEDFAKKKADILSQQARSKALKVFEAFDADKSGTIDAKELQQLVFEMGEVMTKAEVAALFVQLKGGKTGAEDITFDEFFGWWSSKPAGDHASGEKSRFLQMKLQSKSYANLIKSKRKEVKSEKKVSAASNVDSGVDDGMCRLSFDLTVGDFQAATDAITVSTSQTGGAHKFTVGGVSAAPCFEVLFKILPTATPSEIAQVTAVVNNWINVGTAYQTKWLADTSDFDAAGFVQFSIKTIDGERYFALQGQTPKPKQFEQALSFGLENHLRQLEFQFQFDANNFAVKLDTKVTISVEVVDTLLKVSKALGEDDDQISQMLSAAKILKCVEFELHLKSWKEALQKLLKKDSDSSSSSESESESDSSSSSDEPIFKKKKRTTRRRRYASSSSSESDSDQLSESDLEKLATKKIKEVAVGELPFDTFFFDVILKNVYPIMRKELRKQLKQKNKGGILARKLVAGMDADEVLALPFLTLLEPTSAIVSAGSVTGKVAFQLPALFQRDPFFYEKANGAKTLLVRQTLSQSRESFVDHTITVDGQQFKLHKALLSARCPQLSVVEEYKGLTAAEFAHVVKFLYGDELPEDFAELCSALRASRILKFTDMSIAIDRRIWFSLSPYNVYERLIYAAGQPTNEESYLINWFLYYASKNKVPFDRKYTRKQKKAAKKAKIALLPIASPGQTEKLLAAVDILARVESEKENLTVVAPRLGLPKSTLRYAMSQLSQTGEERVCVDLTWFTFHKFVVYPQWSQAQQIIKESGFVDVPAETFERVLQYFYTGDRAALSLTDCHWLAGFGKRSFDTSLTGPASLRVAGRGKAEKWSIAELGEASKCGNFSVGEYYILVDETEADRALKHFPTMKLTAQLAAQQRRASHQLFTK